MPKCKSKSCTEDMYEEKVNDYFSKFTGCYTLSEDQVDKCLAEWEIMAQKKKKIKERKKRLKAEKERAINEPLFDELLEKKLLPKAASSCDWSLKRGIDKEWTMETIYPEDYIPYIKKNHFDKNFKYSKSIKANFIMNNYNHTLERVQFNIKCRDIPDLIRATSKK